MVLEPSPGGYYDSVITTPHRSGPDVSIIGRVPLSYRGSRAATFMVATANATHRQQQMADFRCSGSDDYQVLSTALNALPAEGGSLWLSEGTINLTSPLSRAIDNIHIRGCGRATRINLDGLNPVIDAGTQNGWSIENLDTDAGGVDLGSGENYSTYWRNGTAFLAGVMRIIDPAASDHVRLIHRDNGAGDAGIWFVDSSGVNGMGIECRDITLLAHVILKSPPNFLDLKDVNNTQYAPMRALWQFLVNQNDNNDPTNAVRLANIDDELYVQNYGASALVGVRALQMALTDGV